jgi:hypothetical protein
MIKNDIKALDEFQFFKMQIGKLKNKNYSLLTKSLADFPQAKKDFLQHILSVERVMNEPRKIIKIKRNN